MQRQAPSSSDLGHHLQHLQRLTGQGHPVSTTSQHAPGISNLHSTAQDAAFTQAQAGSSAPPLADFLRHQSMQQHWYQPAPQQPHHAMHEHTYEPQHQSPLLYPSLPAHLLPQLETHKPSHNSIDQLRPRDRIQIPQPPASILDQPNTLQHGQHSMYQDGHQPHIPPAHALGEPFSPFNYYQQGHQQGPQTSSHNLAWDFQAQEHQSLNNNLRQPPLLSREQSSYLLELQAHYEMNRRMKQGVRPLRLGSMPTSNLPPEGISQGPGWTVLTVHSWPSERRNQPTQLDPRFPPL